jgi:hypothetical protein
MTISVKHSFASAKADGTDSTLIQPSNWNAEHTITLAAGKVLGRDTSGSGAVQELPISVAATGEITAATWNATAIGPTYGGTGQTTYTAGDLLYSSSTNTLSKLAAGTNGKVLTMVSGLPAWATAGAGTVTSVDVSGGTTGLTTSGGPLTTSGTITIAGTLSPANGGTGQTTYTNGQLLIGNTTGSTLTKATLTAGTGISITNGNGSITIANSSPSSGGTVTSITAGTGLTGGTITTSGTIAVSTTRLAVGTYNIANYAAATAGSSYAGSTLGLTSGTWLCMNNFISGTYAGGCGSVTVYVGLYIRTA